MARKKNSDTTSDTGIAGAFASAAEPKVRKPRTTVALEPEMQALIDEAKAAQKAQKVRIGQIKKLNKLVTLYKGLDDDGKDQIRQFVNGPAPL